jgi:hypothetical protein
MPANPWRSPARPPGQYHLRKRHGATRPQAQNSSKKTVLLRGRTLLLSRRRLLHHQRRNVPYTTSNTLAKRFARHYILLFVDGAPNHCTGDFVISDNVRLEFLPPYSPELNPQENLWEEIREKILSDAHLLHRQIGLEIHD